MHTHNLKKLIQTRYLEAQDPEVFPILHGEENQNFLVTAGEQKYVLRLYSTHHSTAGRREKRDIETELDFIDHMRVHQVPTPRVIAARDGGRVITSSFAGQIRFAVLFEFIQGQEASTYTAESARSVAETLLLMHNASQLYPVREVRPWPGDIITLSLNLYQANHHQVSQRKEELNDLYYAVQDRFGRIKELALPIGLVHGDVKLGNLLFESNRVKAVLDFDDYRCSYLLEEFTRTLMHDLDSPTRNAVRSGHLSDFLGVFAGDPSISGIELGCLGTFLKTRLLYDLTQYSIQGYHTLVDEVLADRNIVEEILS